MVLGSHSRVVRVGYRPLLAEPSCWTLLFFFLEDFCTIFQKFFRVLLMFTLPPLSGPASRREAKLPSQKLWPDLQGLISAIAHPGSVPTPGLRLPPGFPCGWLSLLLLFSTCVAVISAGHDFGFVC